MEETSTQNTIGDLSQVTLNALGDDENSIQFVTGMVAKWDPEIGKHVMCQIVTFEQLLTGIWID